MSEYTIKHRWTGANLYTGGGEMLRDVVVAAVKSGADLRGADLSYANLRGADLSYADLSYADLRGADLSGAYLSGNKFVGSRPVLQIGPIGSRADYLVAYFTDAGIQIAAGCFFGTIEKFRAACAKSHGDSIHGREYAAAIQMVEAHAALWTTAETAK